MMVVITEHIANSLYGWLSQHLLEVQPNVFMGVVSARVRAHIIQTITRDIKRSLGGATVVTIQSNTLDMATIGCTTYQIHDFDGLKLMVAPTHVPRATTH
jgi:CRISPR-associated endoribonuclease Cas2 subtype I-E